MSTYKDHLCSAMTFLGMDPLFRVASYNVTPPGGSGGGTFNGVPIEQRTECPLAEHNMAGICVGLSLAGFLPMLWLERADFSLLAADAIVNQLDKLALLSNGIHRPAVIIRVCVGNKEKPLFTEPTHVQNFSEAFRRMVTFPVIELHWVDSIQFEYRKAFARMKNDRISTMIIEFKDRYDQTK